MVAIVEKTEPLPIDPLNALANASFDDASTAPDHAPSAAPEVDEQAAMLKKMIEGVALLTFALLKATRAHVAKNLPEILDEWPDAALKAPADAAVPVLQRYAANLTEVLGGHPEAVLLIMACVPLGMGYMTAQSKHATTAKKAQPESTATYTVDAD